jgi:RHS repeat-associated protein
VQVNDYYPFGSSLLTSQLTATEVNHSFTDKEYEEDLGLYYFEARYYDSDIGKFASVDPLVRDSRLFEVISDPQAFNAYAYSRNNPIVFVDPDGELFWVAPIIAIAAYTFFATAQPVNAPAPESEIFPAKTGFDLNLDIVEAAAEGAVTKGIVKNIFQAVTDSVSEGVTQSMDSTSPATPTGRRGSPMDVSPGTNQPTEINGRTYTGHALDQMQGRGFTHSAVEDAITNATLSEENLHTGVTIHYGDGIRAVTNETGDVITVIHN